MGPWTFVRDRLQAILGDKQKIEYAGRAEASSPAVGSPRVHRAQLRAFLEEAFGGLPRDRASCLDPRRIDAECLEGASSGRDGSFEREDGQGHDRRIVESHARTLRHSDESSGAASARLESPRAIPIRKAAPTPGTAPGSDTGSTAFARSPRLCRPREFSESTPGRSVHRARSAVLGSHRSECRAGDSEGCSTRFHFSGARASTLHGSDRAR